ncbi:MAG: hypothetical protein ACR2OH_04330 [Microthrixaceae bacterium]
MLPDEASEIRMVALAPGASGGLDGVVPVLAPSPRSLAAKLQLRREAKWADVVVYFGAETASAAGRIATSKGAATVVLCNEAPRGAAQRRAVADADVVLHDGCDAPVEQSRAVFTGTDPNRAAELATWSVESQWRDLFAELAPPS